jgi:hypothetical protein
MAEHCRPLPHILRWAVAETGEAAFTQQLNPSYSEKLHMHS